VSDGGSWLRRTKAIYRRDRYRLAKIGGHVDQEPALSLAAHGK
jgi:hypothetical protein